MLAPESVRVLAPGWAPGCYRCSDLPRRRRCQRRQHQWPTTRRIPPRPHRHRSQQTLPPPRTVSRQRASRNFLWAPRPLPPVRTERSDRRVFPPYSPTDPWRFALSRYRLMVFRLILWHLTDRLYFWQAQASPTATTPRGTDPPDFSSAISRASHAIFWTIFETINNPLTQ